MNDDGTPFVELGTNAAVKLPTFDKVLGKRGMTRAVLETGEHLDDAKEVAALLKDPEVAKALNEANSDGMWDIAKGTWSNKIRGWLQTRGFARNNKVTETIIRMGRMASVDRKKFLGTAVTARELRSVRSWLPDIGDSFPLMVAKVNVAVKEGTQAFNRFLDTYKNQANMSPFYKAFGINRFGENESTDADTEAAELIRRFGKK